MIMLVVMQAGATPDEIEVVVAAIGRMGLEATRLQTGQRTVVGAAGPDDQGDGTDLENLPGVREIVQISTPYKLASREWHAESTVIQLPGGVTIGGGEVAIIAGPCSVESEGQIVETAAAVRDAGAVVLRGGAFKPRTSPYSFQGLGRKGLRLLAHARAETGLLVCTEAMDPEEVGWVSEVADIVQIGARNMQNYSLLRAAGRCGKPILLKRGLSATVTELLLSAEYLLAEGNREVILCERGIRGVDAASRNLFDVGVIPVVQDRSHLPIIADPSHAAGHRRGVAALARAAVAAGADGVMIEVHPDPSRARSDGRQALRPAAFAELVPQLRLTAEAAGRRVAERVPVAT